MQNDRETLILTRSDVHVLLDYDTCIAAVEDAFRAQAEGRTIASGVLGTHVENGGFHVKTAGLLGKNPRYAAKINANFPGNPSRNGLPTIQGVVGLFDADNGRLLALMDSTEITSIRTAAATAVAAKHLARRDSRSLMIIGCGNQGRSQLRALLHVRPVDNVIAYDSNPELAHRYAREMSDEIGLDIAISSNYRLDLKNRDIVVTCTPSRNPLLFAGDISPGTFIAAVGADWEEKQEIATDLLVSSIVVADVLEQCASIGDLHHAIADGSMRREDVHAELADVVSGLRPGRSSDEDIIVFDSTGTALEDVAAASIVYERALSVGRGVEVKLGT
jgi:alanine dehydrogenase